MMQPQPTLQPISQLPDWLHMLAAVYPPQQVALVGAGNGTGVLVQCLQSLASTSEPSGLQVTLLEPHAPSMAQLAKRLAGQGSPSRCAHWQLRPDPVAPTEGDHTYHHFSLATENSLLPPEALHSLWPSLQLQAQQLIPCVPLASLLPASWLLVDCLPAAHLLQGTPLPASTQVVLARVVLGDTAAPGTRWDEVANLLAPSGFKAVATFAERNSALGKALFVRDPKGLQAQIEQLAQAKDAETTAKLAEAQARGAEQHAKELALAQVQDLLAEKAQLTDAKDKALAQVQQLAQEKAQALQRCDALAKTNSELQTRLSPEKKNATELDIYKKRAADLQKQVDSVMNRFAKTLIEVQRVKQKINAQEQSHQSQPSNKEANSQPPQLIAEFNLGEAWAGNTVNTVIFRHHGIFTHQGHQFTSFYVDEYTLRFVCRRLSDGHITQYDLAGEYNLKDVHNSISMGVDRDGYLHVCFDHHASKLRYRRSLQPMSIGGWTDDQPMTGQYEDKVTYPTFILPRAGYPLTLLYRDGTHNKGCARLKYYNERTQSWKDKPTPILSGADQKPWTSNAYWNHPAIGTDGSLHLSFVWRTGVLGDEQLVNNINIGYAWSPDNGHHWYTLQGQPYQAPITPTTAETIWPVPPGSNLINQCSMALDAYNRPHIVFYANDADGIPQYQHLRYDGKSWHHQTLSQRTQPFNLTGGGTLQIPISRPEVLLDAQGNAQVIYRGDLTDDRMTVTTLAAPGYDVADATQHVLHTDPLGHAEPVLDREGWKLGQKLSMLLQHNRQPNHDENIATATAPVGLCDFEL